MSLANVLLGLTIGFPLMIIAGPLSMLLLDQGLTRGLRGAAPAVAGVAVGDLVLAVVASIGGAALSQALVPIEGTLTVIAVVVLLALAVMLARSAWRELAAARGPGPAPTDDDPTGVATSHGASGPGGTALATRPVSTVTDTSPDGPRVAHLTGFGLAAAFFGATLVNPLTLVLLGSLVIAGGDGMGTFGWALGMAVASAVAHGSYMVLGAVIGGRLGDAAVARIRLGGAGVMVVMAALLYFGLI